MAITVADLKFFASERMGDFSDSGGMMTATEIVSGQSNSIFDDLSDVDRAAGDVSIRKVYAAVTSADTAKYLDAGIAVFREPTDANVAVAAFSTGSFYDERDALKARLEQTITRGARWNGWLWGAHMTGQRALVIWQRPEAQLPSTGARIELVAFSGGVEQYSEFLWITRVSSELRTLYDSNGSYAIRSVTCELSEALTANYTGSEPSRQDPTVSTSSALLYDTRYNAEAVPIYGIMPTSDDAEVGDFTVKIDSLYLPIIPTALTETALPDVTPGGDSPTLVAGNDGTISFTTTTQCIKPNVALYLGTGCTPGTLSIVVSGTTITDDNGTLVASAVVIGEIDYGNGVCTWYSTCANYSTASKSVTFQPAGKPLQVSDSAALHVTAENQGFVWTITLSPIPTPSSLRVSYRVANQWYVIWDHGGGLLSGVDSSYGSGNLNFTTGTVTFTTGAIPDVESDIIFAWSTPALYTARGGDSVDAPVVRGQTAHGGVAPNSVTVTWSSYELTDDGHGALTGTGGVGAIRYATGEWWVRPTTLPAKSTEFSITYDWGTPVEETFSHPIREVSGHLALTLNAQDLKPGTIEVEWNLLIEDYETITTNPPDQALTYTFDPIKIAQDDGNGVLDITSGVDGTVSYVNGTVDFLPDAFVSLPEAIYWTVPIGTNYEGKTVYRNMFSGITYHTAMAYYPSDESGWVKVRYRVVGGDTTATETVTLDQLEFDLTKGYAEQIVGGSCRFKIGTSTYVDIAGQVYRDPGPDTGAGTLCGTLDFVTGRVRINAWTATTNAVTLQSLVTSMDVRPVDEVVFRTPVSPIKSGTLQLRFTTVAGVAKSKTVDGTGNLEDSDCTITVDYPLGIVRARFGLWKLDSELTNDEKLEPWYDPEHRILIGGVLKIWRPKPVLADSIIYNAVAQTFLPPDSALLGLNAARLPPDGRALVFNTGRLVLVHHTDSFTENSLSPTQVLDCERVRLYRAVIEDDNGTRVDPAQYTVDREAGTVTMSPSLDLQGYTAPYTIIHTVADLARLVKVDINGTLTLNKALSHIFPKDDSRVSGVLYCGTLQSRVTNVFAQTTWDGVWQDTVRGSEPLSQYNDTLYPIVVTNAGAYPDRMLVRFTSSTAFQVIGENLGLIATGTINQDCAPVNPLTSETYFTIDYRGWGSGWATGYCLRFNVVGCAYPVDLIRAVQPSSPTGQDDAVELLFVGNVDA